jgi:hypothetical protein
MDRLAGVRAKINRAKQHIGDLERAIHGELGVHPYAELHVTKLNPDSGKVGFFAQLRDIPPDIPLIIGDAIHNLRSALDHLAWQLVVAAGNTPNSQTYFPIYETAEGYNKAKAKGKVKGFNADQMNVLDAMQPYNAGYEPLWLIHKLNNFDKHNLLVVADYRLTSATQVKVIPQEPHPDGRKRSAMVVIPLLPVGEGRFVKDGDELLTYPATSRGEPYKDVGYTLAVAFREPEVAKGYSVLKLLDVVSLVVEQVAEKFVPLLS